jgi:hypothetical protein
MRTMAICRVLSACALMACGGSDIGAFTPPAAEPAGGSAGSGSAGSGSRSSSSGPPADVPLVGADNAPADRPIRETPPPTLDTAPNTDASRVQDRCLIGGCEPTRLPAQPELAFLEDMGDGWQRLMEADWQLSAGSEGYRCMTFTVPEDIYIVAFEPQSPLGTHHATFGVSAAASEDDHVYACGVGTAGDRKLQGSGAGTEASALPPGVAMPIHAGEQVLMNLHLFNIGDQPLSGRSGMWIKTVAKNDVVHEAETVLAGPLSLDIPVGRATTSGSCTIRSDATLFAVGPHMHQHGVHQRVTATTAAGDVAIYDADYDFDHQLYYPVDQLELHAGDRVNVECTYLNDTDGPLHWGDSSLAEMCFTSLSLYPAVGYGSLPCSN